MCAFALRRYVPKLVNHLKRVPVHNTGRIAHLTSGRHQVPRTLRDGDSCSINTFYGSLEHSLCQKWERLLAVVCDAVATNQDASLVAVIDERMANQIVTKWLPPFAAAWKRCRHSQIMDFSTFQRRWKARYSTSVKRVVLRQPLFVLPSRLSSCQPLLVAIPSLSFQILIRLSTLLRTLFNA